MSSTGMNTQVLVVGAGPSGLTLALLLAKSSVPVRIVTKELSPRIGQKGVGIQSRSLELLKLAGLLPAIKHHSLAVSEHFMRVYDTSADLPEGERGVKLLRPAWSPLEPTPPSAGLLIGDGVLLAQDRHEALLRDALTGLGVQVEWGAELVDFDQDESGVNAHLRRTIAAQDSGATVEETVRTGWLVGTDGGRGFVRKALGLSFVGEKRADFGGLVGDVRIEGAQLSRHSFHVWKNGGDMLRMTATTSAPDDEDLFMMFAAGSGVDCQALMSNKQALEDHIARVTGRHDIKLKKIEALHEYYPNIRMVDKCNVGRIFVAGDAAHVHSPTGGQGLNTCIQDSFNLAWKLALVAKGYARPTLLDTYSEERLPVIAEMLDMTTKLLDKIAQYINVPAPSASSAPEAGKAGAGDALRRGVVFQMLGVNYRWSSIVLDDRLPAPYTADERGKMLTKAYEGGSPGDSPRVGDRAPDAPGLMSLEGSSETTTLLDIFSTTRHTALVFAADGQSARDLLGALQRFPNDALRVYLILPQGSTMSAASDANISQVFIDSGGHAHTEYAIALARPQPTVVIVRSDAYVGAIATKAEGVQRYCDAVFSA